MNYILCYIITSAILTCYDTANYDTFRTISSALAVVLLPLLEDATYSLSVLCV